jgi:hypothetical protein
LRHDRWGHAWPGSQTPARGGRIRPPGSHATALTKPFLLFFAAAHVRASARPRRQKRHDAGGWALSAARSRTDAHRTRREPPPRTPAGAHPDPAAGLRSSSVYPSASSVAETEEASRTKAAAELRLTFPHPQKSKGAPRLIKRAHRTHHQPQVPSGGRATPFPPRPHASSIARSLASLPLVVAVVAHALTSHRHHPHPACNPNRGRDQSSIQTSERAACVRSLAPKET